MKKLLTSRFEIDLCSKILGFLIKKGKKKKIEKILKIAFSKISSLTKKPIHYILVKFFISLNVFVETKTVKVKRSRHVVPFPLSLKRRIYLIIKWFVFVLNKNKNKVSFSNKFTKEIFLVLKNKKSEVYKLKNLNNSRALMNRSNIHYRW